MPFSALKLLCIISEVNDFSSVWHSWFSTESDWIPSSSSYRFESSGILHKGVKTGPTILHTGTTFFSWNVSLNPPTNCTGSFQQDASPVKLNLQVLKPCSIWEAFQEIKDNHHTHSEYELAFWPSSNEADEKWHPITILVPATCWQHKGQGSTSIYTENGTCHSHETAVRLNHRPNYWYEAMVVTDWPTPSHLATETVPRSQLYGQ